MAITTLAVANFIGAGLAGVAWGAVEKAGIEPALQPGVDKVKGWLEDGRKKKQADKALRDAVQKAFTAIGAPQGEEDFSGWALRLGFDRLQGTGKTNRPLRDQIARAALLMRSPDPAEVPRQLYDELRWPSDQRDILAQFLYVLRQELAKNEAWQPLITYSEQEAVRDYLSLAVGSLERIEALLTALTDYYGIAPAEQDEQALKDFLEFMRTRYRLLSFVFIKPAGTRDDVVTEAELEAVYVPLQVQDPDQIEAARREMEMGLRRSERQEEKAERALTINDVLAEYPVFLLKGEPGSGKTTLLRYITLSFARNEAKERLHWPADPLLPIFVPLRNFGRYLQNHPYDNNAPRPLREFIEVYFRDNELEFPPRFFRDRLKQGRCLVLLDGLDEVADRALRADVAQIVSAFIRYYEPRGNRFALASRPKGYDEVAAYLPKPVVCTVQRLEPEGRDTLVRNLLRQFGGARRKQDAEIEDLLQDIRNKSRVDELSRNPLFCTTLVLVYKYRGARLPERRVDVYQEIVNLMLGFWETHRAEREGVAAVRELVLMDGTGRAFMDEDEAIEAKGRALIHIAEWMQAAGDTEVQRERVEAELARYFVTEEGAEAAEADDWARGFLRVAHQRSGLFVEQDPDTFAFAHKNFLEYLAATSLVEQPDADMLAVIASRAGDEWWHEVILLAAAHPGLGKSPKRRNAFVQKLLDEGQVVLAGECAVDAGARLPKPMRQKVLAALYDQMTDMDRLPKERFAAGVQWDALGGPPPDVNRWLKCPACGENREDLLVAKYPVTNAQFALFMEAGGYENAAYWGGEDSAAWRWRVKEHNADWRGEKPVTQPEYWRDGRFGKERRGFPVVGVSWYEAQAYCRWLTSLLERLAAGKDAGVTEEQYALVADLVAAGARQVRLPVEQEWVNAAGGEQNGRYPWDRGVAVTNAADTDIVTARANVDESGIGQTTPAAMFPAGESPLGLMDMAGNVWEWMGSYYDDDRDTFALRGGSWNDVLRIARVASSYWNFPNVSFNYYGFRAVSPVVLPSDR